MRAGYGEALRGYFASKTHPIMLVDFAGIKIFDAITVEANILLSQKAAKDVYKRQDTRALHPRHIGTTSEGRRYIRIRRAKTDVEAFICLLYTSPVRTCGQIV